MPAKHLDSTPALPTPPSPGAVPPETMRRILRVVELHRPNADAVAVSIAVNLTWAARGRAEGMARA